ncbi:MAG: hypothetical protein FJZ01_23265 [Candidatus Sericytochromatia bacterium]|nr:hypothetical protein [Candidatus Tanganyikabacteria bacterium]
MPPRIRAQNSHVRSRARPIKANDIAKPARPAMKIGFRPWRSAMWPQIGAKKSCTSE